MENIAPASSPPSVRESTPDPCRSAPSTGSSKLQRPPTVTPRRFKKFFQIRASHGVNSKGSSGRELRDITFNEANSSPVSFDSNGDFPVARSSKRQRRGSDMNDEVPIFSSSLPSSPLGKVAARPTPKLDAPRAIVKAKPLERNALWKYQASDFVSGPKDRRWSRQYGITFCSVACNTNSLFATGTELGRILILDSDAKGSLRDDQPWITMNEHNNAITDLSFSSDDNYIASVGGDSTTKIIDMHTQSAIHSFSSPCSLKQVQFQPGSDSIVATVARNSNLAIWDLRCQSSAGPAYYHCINTRIRDGRAKQTEDRSKPKSNATAMQFLSHGREHLFVTAADNSAQLQLWDMRTKRSRVEEYGTPMSVTDILPHHRVNRNHGVNWLSLSTDGSRLYSVCKDSTVYVYSTNHLILGQGQELSQPASYPRRFHNSGKGLGPLYGFRNPCFLTSSFYVRSAIRRATPDNPEVLAVGSSWGSPVLFPTDERLFASQLRKSAALPEDGLVIAQSCQRKAAQDTVPIIQNGTALLRGHDAEVTSLSWTHGGELVTVADDFSTRCWREDAQIARDMRVGGEEEGRRHMWGWSEMEEAWDEEDG